MKNIFYHKKKCLHLPDNLDELSPHQYLGIANLLYDGGNEIACKVKALRILSDISKIRLLLIPSEKISRCLEYVDWIFEAMNITKQLLPSYKGYYGPADELDNLKMKEFHFSEHFYHRHLIDKDETALDKLIATLYRKPKSFFKYDRKKNIDGDLREPFNLNLVEKHAALISRWPESVKYAIFLFYDGCRQQFIDDFPMIFKEPVKSGYQSQYNAGLYGMMLNLAGEKLGRIDQVEEMYVPTALLTLGMMKEQERFFEEEMKK